MMKENNLFKSGLFWQQRTKIDLLVTKLEDNSPNQGPLDADSDYYPLLFGCWKLLYASNGTVVTRTVLVQSLSAASAIPGVGLRNVQQRLSKSAGNYLEDRAQNTITYCVGKT